MTLTLPAAGAGADVGDRSVAQSGPGPEPAGLRLAPGAPTSVIVTPGILTLNVQFTPGSVGGGVVGYTATAVGGPSTGPCTTTNISTTPCVIKGVTAGTAYTVTVVANGTVASGNSVPSEASSPVTAVAWPAPTLPVPAPTGAALYGPVTSSAGSTLGAGTQTTVSGNGYAAYTGITVGLYQAGVVRQTWTAMTDSTGAFTVPVTIPGSGSGVTAGTATLVGAGMTSTGTVRYRASTVTVTVPTFSALSASAVQSRFALAAR